MRILASLLATTMAATAADLPLPQTEPFTGFYIGGDVGYGNSLEAINFNYPNGSAYDLGGTTNAPHGFIGSAHAGYGARVMNYFYLGGEGNFSWSQISGVGTVPPTILLTDQLGVVASNKWLSSVRGRLGFITVGTVLVYGTLGWGWADSKVDVNYAPVEREPTIATNSFVHITSGVTWGGGVEFPLFSSNWLGRFQYLAYDLGNMTVAVPTGTFSQRNRVHTLEGGLSFKF